MFSPKQKWGLVFGFVFFVLPFVPAVVEANAPAVCLIADQTGILESDAQTAAMLICDELRKQGIPITDPVYEAPASAHAYRVVLRRLGENIFVRLSHENPIGTIIAEQQLILANIEEMIPAAPKLVDALVHNKPIDAIVDLEGVTEQETRDLRKIAGQSLWHMKIFGTFIPGTAAPIEPGFEFGWSHETLSYAVGTELLYTAPEEDDDSDNTVTYFAYSIGGRYFFKKRSISPYVGGGLAVVNATYETRVWKQIESFSSAERYSELQREEWVQVNEQDSDFGLGTYAVVGIAALRFTEIRFNLELRVERPFFKLQKDVMPITFGISLAWNYVPGSSGCFLF